MVALVAAEAWLLEASEADNEWHPRCWPPMLPSLLPFLRAARWRRRSAVVVSGVAGETRTAARALPLEQLLASPAAGMAAGAFSNEASKRIGCCCCGVAALVCWCMLDGTEEEEDAPLLRRRFHSDLRFFGTNGDAAPFSPPLLLLLQLLMLLCRAGITMGPGPWLLYSSVPPPKGKEETSMLLLSLVIAHCVASVVVVFLHH